MLSKLKQRMRNMSQRANMQEREISVQNAALLPTRLTHYCVRPSHILLLQLFHFVRNPLISWVYLFRTYGYPLLLSFSSNTSFLLQCFLETPYQSFCSVFASPSSAFTIAGTRSLVFCNRSSLVISVALSGHASSFNSSF